MVHVDFVAALWHLPLKTPQYPHNPFTEQELYDIFALIFGYVFLNNDEVMAFKIDALAAEVCDAVSALVKVNVKEVQLGGFVKKLADEIEGRGILHQYGNALIRRFLDEGMSFEEIVWIIIPTAAAGCANQAQQVCLDQTWTNS